MTLTINLSSTAGVNFNSDFKSFFADLTPAGWPYILGGAGQFEGKQIVLLDEIEAGKERNTKAIVIDGKDFNYYFNDHTLSGTMTSIRLSTLGNSYDAGTQSFTQNSSGLIANVSTSIEITGLDIYNAYRERGDFHDVAYALMGGAHAATGTSDPSELEAFLWAEAHKVNGSSGADTYSGTRFADTIYGNGGNDTLAGNGGNDKIYGGAGTDTAVYTGSKSSYSWKKNGDGTWTITDSRKGGTTDGADTLVDIENLKFSDTTVSLTDTSTPPDDTDNDGKTVNGTGKADKLTGTSGDDVIKGKGGGDTLNGSAGKDKLYGGTGNDTLNGGTGNDTLSGGSGNDNLQGGSGNDKLYGGAGTDKLNGGSGNDTLGGGTGNDNLKGGSGKDALSGGTGNDTLDGGTGNDVLKGDSGNDKLYGGTGADKLYGGSGKDTFIFKSVKDTTVATSGRDTIYDFDGKAGDRIDLRSIDASTKADGDQKFSFIGTDKFSKTAGELRYEKKASDTYIHGDVNGDGKADFTIHLDDALSFSKGYFLL
ncbi:calcium-binding protein [Shinella sp. S4-D37]|uniref:calcium-binding protein n=1 Tax=Shinella sp. S4-D37 TaxID=3161999 RepID=UPI0034655338